MKYGTMDFIVVCNMTHLFLGNECSVLSCGADG